MDNHKSRRRSERVSAQLQIRWHRGPNIVDAVTGDISNEGMFIRTPEETSAGSLMQIEVAVPGEPPLTMFVTAAFVGKTTSGCGIGAEIFVIGSDEKRRWRRFYLSMIKQKTELAGAA